MKTRCGLKVNSHDGDCDVFLEPPCCKFSPHVERLPEPVCGNTSAWCRATGAEWWPWQRSTQISCFRERDWERTPGTVFGAHHEFASQLYSQRAPLASASGQLGFSGLLPPTVQGAPLRSKVGSNTPLWDGQNSPTSALLQVWESSCPSSQGSDAPVAWGLSLVSPSSSLFLLFPPPCSPQKSLAHLITSWCLRLEEPETGQ